jgi:hypothetical protein
VLDYAVRDGQGEHVVINQQAAGKGRVGGLQPGDLTLQLADPVTHATELRDHAQVEVMTDMTKQGFRHKVPILHIEEQVADARVRAAPDV